MDKKEAEEYLKKLEEFEKTINSEDDEENFDLNFIEEINTLLSKLEGEINKNETIKTESIINNFTLDIKVKKLHPNAVIPSYSKVGDAGMDLTITSEIENTTFSVSYGFGIAMEIPKNYC